ncbi:KUP/HAK/KT family potassium transporter [Xylocopilactobacillus apicola]|uniref:Probable potassium transport system protein Kup n=1 Tax=Xylocopilactobacillus apicola TaxID=2932184 RepID=A0AAU9D014_9LACO|nr:KUP/HAK/KT family potassium transporter [Xylocopilactobacillus apicola]BDR59594.1 putative potassium transport system protein kup [Xylocopilactobacillus apicola]
MKDIYNKKPDAHKSLTKVSVGTILITLGVVYGDIGTSPLYVMKAILADNGGIGKVSPDYVIGALSLVFWTVMIMTTLKYVLIALKADNKGEGGIFSLYTLVRKRHRWLIIIAMIGGASLLADGMLTPAVTVTTAVEGLKGVKMFGNTLVTDQREVIIMTVIILSILFFIQKFGTNSIGRLFGPVMAVWFTFLGAAGLFYVMQDWTILRALNPIYAIKILFSPENHSGIFILGSVFLATTGAEALYSDMGHVGAKNIYASWPYVCICLVLNYLGQGVWILNNRSNTALAAASEMNPFYSMLPKNILIFGIIISTLAAIIASQALISGSYTLVSEAIKLKILPRLKIIYPTNIKGQLYIPSVNNLMWVICVLIVFYFRTSSHMEAAYGLAITLTMLMTTLLLYQFMRLKKLKPIFAAAIVLFFGSIETIFFLSSLVKFTHGGYVTAIIALSILAVMSIWSYGGTIKAADSYQADAVSILSFKDQLHTLSNDDSLPVFATNLICLCKSHAPTKIKRDIMYSILDKRPKRAKVYWFVTVNVTDEPYTQKYTVETYDTDYLVNIQLYLGFRVDQKINVFMRQVVNDLMQDGTIPRQPQKYTIIPDRQVGDFSFLIIKDELSPETELPPFEKFIVRARLSIEKITIAPDRWYGLEYADTSIEHVPLMLHSVKKRYSIYNHLKRVPVEETQDMNVDSEIDDSLE